MFEAKTGAYSFQLDEDWFRLDANLLTEALEITPVDQAHQFMSPPSGDAIMDFVNQLGYPGEIHFVPRMAAQISNSSNAIGSTKKGKKTKPHVILYSRFTKLFIYHLKRHHNIHQRSRSPLNFAEDDLSLGNLKFVPKAKIDKHERKIAAEKEIGKKKTTPKTGKPMKPTPAKQAKPTPAKQPNPKPIKEKSTKQKPTPTQKARKDAKIGTDMNKVINEGDIEILNINEEQEEDVDIQVYLEEQTAELDEGHAGSDLGNTLESRTLPDDDKIDEDQAGLDSGKSNVALAGPNLDPMHDDFIAFQAPVRDRFKELLEADMKEILHQRMFESGSYKSLPEHVALYKALEAYIERANRDKFLAEKDKSRKRRRDDQDPPSLPPDSDLSKKKRHDSNASGSK
nr:hypothetical protein [Tanacetum cinerariifolium]